MYNLVITDTGQSADTYEEQLAGLGALSLSRSCDKKGSVVLTAMFDSSERAEVALKSLGLSEGEVVPVSEDWMDRWVLYAQPVYLVPEVMVLPHPADMTDVPEGVTTLHIGAEGTFGYGAHPTTRICAEILRDLSKKISLNGLSVLDIGCGSGVLSFYADILGAGDVVGFDIDARAVEGAVRNCEINGLKSCRFLKSSVDDFKPEPCDLCVVNIPVAEYENNRQKLLDISGTSRYSVFSGFSIENIELIKKLFEGTLNMCNNYEKEGWAGLLGQPV